jgi:hypothetical protein
MGTLLEDLDAAAAWIATALSSSGYRADYSPESLWSVDRFLDEHSENGEARRRGLLATDLGGRLFALGAYTGEVIRRSAGGTWQVDDEDPQGEINVQLVLADGGTVWPVQRVLKRFSNGPEDGVAAYGVALGLDVGPAPATPDPRSKRRFFRT